MAKELIVTFIYDRELCRREEDDPDHAVLYFYPSWVSEEQRVLLCGQLIGVTHFIESTFSPPSILSMENGKFSMKIFGRYILCVGTDRNIPDSVLSARAKIIHQLLQFYHGDFHKFMSKYSTATRREMYEKLSNVFEVYLPIMIYAGNIFSTIPLLTLPKSGSSAFLEASQILQHFQRMPGVLGGIVLYQNKVIVTQLGKELTKILVISDPYRIKVPASSVETPFHLPFKVQLLNIFLKPKISSDLVGQRLKMCSAIDDVPLWQEDSVKVQSTIVPSVLPMKRDKSRIFTVVEEEDDTAGGGDNSKDDKSNKSDDQCIPTTSGSKSVPDLVKDAILARWSSRMDVTNPVTLVIPESSKKLRRRFSADDGLQIVGRVMPMRYYSLGLPQVKDEWCNNKPAEDILVDRKRIYCNTISDPVNLIFRSNGLPASKSLYQERLIDHYQQIDAEVSKENDKAKRPSTVKFKENPEGKLKKQEKLKKNMSLCLNPAPPTDLGEVSASDVKRGFSQGVPLTPLLAKLAMVANAAQTPSASLSSLKHLPDQLTSSTSSSKVSNEIDTSESVSKSDSAKRPNSHESESSHDGENNDEDEDDEKNLDLKEYVLYVFGEHSTSVMLIMEQDSSQDPDHIHSLWESCNNFAVKLEERLRKVVEQNPNAGLSASADSYSFLCVEPEWGSMQRGGSWTAPQLEMLTTLHDDLAKRPNITDCIVRCDESIIYANQCGKKKIFYQQSAGSNSSLSGLPTPSDLMGVVSLKARRRLERDHNVIIL